VIEGLGADRERLSANLRGGAGISGGILAEPAYILLAETGVSGAHEVIRKITLKAERENLSFAQALAAEPDILGKIGAKMCELGIIALKGDALTFFENPERYSGLSATKAKALAQKYRKLMEG
jgi:adenylosuccinate lyase